jgi:hypothetical protein
MPPLTRELPRRAARPALLLALAGAAALLGACGEEDATSIRITLKPDLSGTVITSSIHTPAQPTPAEAAANGVTFSARGGVAVAKGAFTDIRTIKLADLTFAHATTGSQQTLIVTIPRGPKALWPATLSIPAEADRKKAAAIVDEKSRVGETLKLEVTLPVKVANTGFNGKARGASTSSEDTKATFLVPVDVAYQPGDPLVWYINYQTP